MEKHIRHHSTMIEKLSQSGSLVRFQDSSMAQFLRRKYRRPTLILGGTLLLAAMIAVSWSSKWSHGSSDCMAQTIPVDRILPTLTIYSHLPKPNDEDVPHYILTRARSCFPKLAAHFRETDIPTHLLKGRPPYLEGDPVSVYRGGEVRWLFEVRSREIPGLFTSAKDNGEPVMQ